MSYHHGDLRRTILAAAADAIAESGPAGWSLRELARRAGVSHAAPAHHFGDKAGLFTQLAAEGYAILTDRLIGAGADFLDLGLAYVRFAVEHRAHFTVMFQPSLYHADDPEVAAAGARAREALERGAARTDDGRSTALAGWSIAHGFAGLWLNGALPYEGDPGDGSAAVAAARPVLRRLLAAGEDGTA